MRRIFMVPQERRATEVQLAILEELILLRKDLRQMQQQIQDSLNQLQQQVAAETTAEQSAVTLLTGLHDQLEAALANAGSDPTAVVTAIQGISAQLKTDTDALAAAVTANTPAAASSGSTGGTTGTDTGAGGTTGSDTSRGTGTSGDATDPTA